MAGFLNISQSFLVFLGILDADGNKWLEVYVLLWEYNVSVAENNGPGESCSPFRVVNVRD